MPASFTFCATTAKLGNANGIDTFVAIVVPASFTTSLAFCATTAKLGNADGIGICIPAFVAISFKIGNTKLFFLDSPSPPNELFNSKYFVLYFKYF